MYVLFVTTTERCVRFQMSSRRKINFTFRTIERKRLQKKRIKIK